MKKHQKTKSLRRKGEKSSSGQQGHKGLTLQHVPNPDRITISAVDECERCHADLSQQPVEKVIKRQIVDIPKPAIEVDEYQVEVKRCCCGCVNTGSFPDGNSPGTLYGRGDGIEYIKLAFAGCRDKAAYYAKSFCTTNGAEAS